MAAILAISICIEIISSFTKKHETIETKLLHQRTVEYLPRCFQHPFFMVTFQLKKRQNVAE